jgi:hypothetical protein
VAVAKVTADPRKVVAFFDLWTRATDLYQTGPGNGMYPYQRDLTEHAAAGESLLVSKSRQTGISTWCGMLAAYEAVVRGRPVNVFSNRQDQSWHLVRNYVRPAVRSLLGMLRDPPEMTVDKAGMLAFATGGQVTGFAADDETARGYPAGVVILDEFAHHTRVGGLDRRLYEASQASTARIGGYMVVVSTPKGQVGEFYALWTAPPAEGVAVYRREVRWSECPWLKERVRQVQTAVGPRWYVPGSPRALRPQEFAQEYDCSFLEGSGSMFGRAQIPSMLAPDSVAWE